MKFSKGMDDDFASIMPPGQRAGGFGGDGRTPSGDVLGTNGNDFIHPAGDGRTAPPHYNDIAYHPSGADHIGPGAGDDIIYGSQFSFTYADFGANLTAKDQVFGAQYVTLDGDYSQLLTLTTFNLNTVGEVDLKAGHDYNLRFGDGISHSAAF